MLDVGEALAGIDEALCCVITTVAIHAQTVFANARGQPREVTVAADEAETSKAAGMEEIHRVDDQSAVTRVLADGVAVLLNWVKSVVRDDIAPGGEVLSGEVAIDTAHGDPGIAGEILDDCCECVARDIIGVDQQRERRQISVHLDRKGIIVSVCAGVGRMSGA
jgi:hypothetical protein